MTNTDLKSTEQPAKLSEPQELSRDLIVVARNLRNFTVSANLAGAEVCEAAARYLASHEAKAQNDGLHPRHWPTRSQRAVD